MQYMFQELRSKASQKKALGMNANGLEQNRVKAEQTRGKLDKLQSHRRQVTAYPKFGQLVTMPSTKPQTPAGVAARPSSARLHDSAGRVLTLEL